MNPNVIYVGVSLIVFDFLCGSQGRPATAGAWLSVWAIHTWQCPGSTGSSAH